MLRKRMTNTSATESNSQASRRICVTPRTFPGRTACSVGFGHGAFLSQGIPKDLNDVLIGHFMKSLEISRFQAGLVQSAFYLGYFLLAIPAALLLKRTDCKSGFVVGLLLFGTGAFLFWPVAVAGSYGFFLFALFVIASGLSFLETASNPFIAQLGDPDSSERRLNCSQAFNPIGAISGALIGTVLFSPAWNCPSKKLQRELQTTLMKPICDSRLLGL